MDLDFDGDYDSTDATKFDALSSGIARHPGRTATGVSQPFAHQGLLFEAEIGSYQNRAREYEPTMRVFFERDPLYERPRPRILTNECMHLYLVLRANPQRYRDPKGLWTGSYNCTFSNGGCCCGLGGIFCYQACGRNCTLTDCITDDLGDPCPPIVNDATTYFQLGCLGCPIPPGGTNPGDYECTQTPPASVVPH